MTDPADTSKAKANLSAAAKKIDLLADTITSLGAKIATLEEAGTVQASEYWRQGKYLYLIHPTTQGHRVREYIGKDAKKVQDAQDRVDRWKKANILRTDRDGIAAQLKQVIDTTEALLHPGELSNLYWRYASHRYY